MPALTVSEGPRPLNHKPVQRDLIRVEPSKPVVVGQSTPPPPGVPGRRASDNARAAASLLRLERVALRVLNRVDRQVDVEIRPEEVSRLRPLESQDRLRRR